MVTSVVNHVSVLARDLEESAGFYESVFGMERIPSANFSVPVQWLQCGDRQLHLFERDMEAVDYYHFGLHVDDFEEVYEAVQNYDGASFDSFGDVERDVDKPYVYELPDGAAQMYVRDPAGNLLEVNYPDVEELDRSIVTTVIDRDDLVEQSGEASEAVLYGEGFLEGLSE